MPVATCHSMAVEEELTAGVVGTSLPKAVVAEEPDNRREFQGRLSAHAQRVLNSQAMIAMSTAFITT